MHIITTNSAQDAHV